MERKSWNDVRSDLQFFRPCWKHNLLFSQYVNYVYHFSLFCCWKIFKLCQKRKKISLEDRIKFLLKKLYSGWLETMLYLSLFWMFFQTHELFFFLAENQMQEELQHPISLLFLTKIYLILDAHLYYIYILKF